MIIAIFKVVPQSAVIILILVSCLNSVSAQPPPPSSFFTYDLSFRDRTYSIQYAITSGEVTDISADERLLTVSVKIQNTEDGVLQISFPRDFMTRFFKVSDEAGSYNAAEVFVDTIPVEPEISANCQVANYRIPISAGAEDIEFNGSYVPEDLSPSQIPDRYAFFYRVTYAPREYYNIRVATNADECNISLNIPEKQLHAIIQGALEERGYLAVVLPHNLLRGNYTVLLDGVVVDYNSTFVPRGFYFPLIREDSTAISISYESSDKPTDIEIIGTWVIPEFGRTLILSTTLVAGFIAAFLSRKYGLLSRFPPR